MINSREKKPAAPAMTPDACRRIRRSLSLTQEQFAERLDVTALTVLRWENGQTPISRGRAFAIRAVARAIQSGGVA